MDENDNKLNIGAADAPGDTDSISDAQDNAQTSVDVGSANADVVSSMENSVSQPVNDSAETGAQQSENSVDNASQPKTETENKQENSPSANNAEAQNKPTAKAEQPNGNKSEKSKEPVKGGGEPLKKPNDKKSKDTKSKNGKKPTAAEKRQNAKMQKEWEDSIVASKRVKREEIRRKVKQATVIMLVFALIVTSIVYVMLLFVQENNVRITASNKGQDTLISLSLDNSIWTPYINANGPETIWDVSYSPLYDREKLDTVDEVREMLDSATVPIGEMNGDNFIRFVFMVKNSGKVDANISYEMTLDYDHRGLQNAVRVMWGESFKGSDSEASVDIYASRSNNPRLAGTNINLESSPETGYIEYVAYPVGSDDPTYSLTEYERSFSNPNVYDQAVANGYFATTPFLSENYVFQRHSTLPQDDIMYCYVCIWLEGSDFDCVNSALGGYVKLGINFIAY